MSLAAFIIAVSGLFIPMEPEFPVSHEIATRPSTTQAPDVAISDDGRVVTVWATESPSGFNSNTIKFAIIEPDGTLVNSSQPFSSGSETLYHDPAVAMASNGRFVVVATIERTDLNDTNIIARTFAADGTPERNSFTVNNDLSSQQRHADVAMFANGDFYVVYEQDFSITDTDIYYAGWFNSSTNPFSQFLAPTAYAGESDNAKFPRIALDTGVVSASSQDTAGVVCFTRPDTNGFDEYVTRILNVDGTRRANRIPAPAVAQTEDAKLGDVAMADNGDYVVVWNEGDLVYRRRFNKDGVAQNMSNLVAGPGFGAFHDEIRVAMGKDGDYTTLLSYDGNIYATEYNANDTARKLLLAPESVRKLSMSDCAIDVSRNGEYAAISWKTRVVNEYIIMTRRFRRVADSVDTDGDGMGDNFEMMAGSDFNNASSLPELLDFNLDGQVNSADAIQWYRHLTGVGPVIVPGS